MGQCMFRNQRRTYGVDCQNRGQVICIKGAPGFFRPEFISLQDACCNNHKVK